MVKCTTHQFACYAVLYKTLVFSDDQENKWQLEEVLGAVHFRLAVYDCDIPKPVMSDSARPLSKLQLEHMEKSIMFYKEALADQAKLLKDTSSVQDRILKKLILVQTFKETSQKVCTLLYLTGFV